ncbi:MAG TPA: M20/M25/M40 family metallo-hydrolase [Telluria sp.]|nr:M20/M25/M40 family metallo-hydrolase [Telluria sp.]
MKARTGVNGHLMSNYHWRLDIYGTMMKHLLFFLALACATSTVTATPGDPASTLVKVRDTAMSRSYAYERLSDLTDLIGPRLAGSPGAAAAVSQVAGAMRKLGANVSLQPVKVPHWVRGDETGTLVGYAGRPAGVSQKISLTALGGSGSTGVEGVTAPVLIVYSFDEFKLRTAEARGKIVLFDVPFDQVKARTGLASHAYGAAVAYRAQAPRMAAEAGAVAALVRSVGGANFRLPHTGATVFGPAKPIPAAAVAPEDAMLMTRLAARGPVTMHLTLTPRTLPDADSYNVIADWPGTDKADEVVIVSAHLDSWDVGTGAHDDGAGMAAAMGVLDVLRTLNLRPRRTIRVIAWMNEESGGSGANAYLNAMKTTVARHFAGIESDSGMGRPLGIQASIGKAAVPLFEPLQKVLAPLGADVLRREDALDTGDLYPLENAGMPSFEPLGDSSTYFDYHHTNADTLDKIDPDNLRRHVAVMASLAWFLANLDQAIGQAPVAAEAR